MGEEEQKNPKLVVAIVGVIIAGILCLCAFTIIMVTLPIAAINTSLYESDKDSSSSFYNSSVEETNRKLMIAFWVVTGFCCFVLCFSLVFSVFATRSLIILANEGAKNEERNEETDDNNFRGEVPEEKIDT